MDKGVDQALPPTRFAFAVPAEPIVIGLPMARLVLLDDPEDLEERSILTDDRMPEQDFDLAIAPPFGQRDDPAQLLEMPILNHAVWIKIVNP